MKVLFVNPSGILGGAERSLLDLMASLRAARPSLDVGLLLLSGGPLGEAAEALGVRSRILPMPGSLEAVGDSALSEGAGLMASARVGLRLGGAACALPGYLGRLRARIREERPDIIHSNGNKAHLVASLAASGVPVVWHIRDFIGSRRLMATLLRRARSRATGAIAISEAVRRDAEAALPGFPVDVVYNAIDVGTFSPGPGDARRLDELAGFEPAAEGMTRVGLVATYASWKGHALFLEAAAAACRSLAPGKVRFYVVGGALYATRGSQVSEGDLKARARSLGIADRVGFVGFQSDVAGVYRALDIVVHASTRPEPFGRTIVEAMACGRAVIAARAGGAAELFTHGADAIGFESGDSGALASAIVSLVPDEILRRRLGEGGRRTALSRFARERLGGEVGRVYDRIAAP